MEAAQRVLDLTGNKKYDGELLERIVQEMEKRYSTATACDKDFTNQTTSESELAYSRETQRLMDMLGKVLQQVYVNSCYVLSSSSQKHDPVEKISQALVQFELSCSGN